MHTLLWSMTSVTIGLVLACASGPEPSPAAVNSTRQVAARAVPAPAASDHSAMVERAMFRARMRQELDLVDHDLAGIEEDLRLGATETRILSVESLRRAHRMLSLSLDQMAGASDDDWRSFAVGFSRSLKALKQGVEAARVMDDFSDTRHPARV